MVVTNSEPPLIQELEMWRKVFNPVHDFPYQLLKVDPAATAFKFCEMVIFQTHQVTEDGNRATGSGPIKFVPDG